MTKLKYCQRTFIRKEFQNITNAICSKGFLSMRTRSKIPTCQKGLRMLILFVNRPIVSNKGGGEVSHKKLLDTKKGFLEINSSKNQ